MGTWKKVYKGHEFHMVRSSTDNKLAVVSQSKYLDGEILKFNCIYL